MTYFKEVSPNVDWVTKGHGAIFTTEGNLEKILDIIKALDKDEFIDYGFVEGRFVLPIYETLEQIGDNHFLAPKYSLLNLDYYGKFSLDVEGLIEACHRVKIPCVVISEKN